MFSWSLGVYDSYFLAIHEDRGKRVKAINALIHSFDLTIVNDRRFLDRISSVDQYLSLRCYFRIFKRVIPLHTRLLRLTHSSPFSRFLVRFSKMGISVKRSNPGHSWKQTKGNKLPRMDWKSDLVQLMHNQIHLSTYIMHGIFYYKHISIHSYQTLHRHSNSEIIHNFTVL
jgi:hypothetical protein